MRRLHIRVLCSVGFFVLLIATASPAAAQSVTVTLDPGGERVEANGQFDTGKVTYSHHWGTVLLSGQPVGTYTLRRGHASILADAAVYTTETASIWIRVTGSSGLLIMEGAVTASPVPYVGGVTVVPPGLEFLRGAAIALTSAPSLSQMQQGALTIQY